MMENLRWILIFAGVAILVLLYLSGRQPKASKRQDDALRRPDASKRGSDRNTTLAPPADPLLGDNAFSETAEPIDPLDDPLADPLERPGGQAPVKTRRSAATGGGLGGISSKIEAFGSKLNPRRRSNAAASGSRSRAGTAEKEYDSKIVTLHVVAPEGQLMNGAHLLEQFEQRGYHFGDMNIFHSMHEGKTVFSIAKLVVPGTFDINDVDSFQTPGISLILQLPGPAPADVAFEVLLSEAHEIADALGGTVLDADRSTLSKQTIQHMREGISEYMHRQKYFSGVPS